jgi:polyferredoxin
MATATQKSNPGRTWRVLRIVVQVVFFFLFLVFFISTQRDGWQPQTANLSVRLSPLTMLANWIASRKILLTSLVGLVLVGVALVFGRAWCGWLCPLGSLIDLFSFKKWFKRKIRIAEGWRAVKTILLIVILSAAIFGNLSLLILDPITIFYRTFTIAVWPALDWVVTAAETGLYRISALQNGVAAFDSVIRPAILPYNQAFGRGALLLFGFFLVILVLNLLTERFWCRYLCPLGGLLGLLAKVGLVKRQVLPTCTNCNACARVCPTGTIDTSKGYASDPAECTLCLDCYQTCPSKAIAFKLVIKPVAWNSYDPGRRSVLIGMGAGAALGAASLVTPKLFTPPDTLLRPPGVINDTLLSRCIRCGDCMRICPTSALQPAFVEAGWDGLWTPVLVPRIGYCDYGCNRCGQVCPVEAIPNLSLAEKQVQVMGKAAIDKERCLAWGLNQNCVVCEEMCPLPQKAIHFAGEGEGGGQGKHGQGEDSEAGKVPRPVVSSELCIGCGICENKCPVEGVAAIWVKKE